MPSNRSIMFVQHPLGEMYRSGIDGNHSWTDGTPIIVANNTGSCQLVAHETPDGILRQIYIRPVGQAEFDFTPEELFNAIVASAGYTMGLVRAMEEWLTKNPSDDPFLGKEKDCF